MRRSPDIRARRQKRAAPGLLIFVAATLAMVVAIAAIARIDPDRPQLVANALLLVVLGLLISGLRRRLDDHEPKPRGETRRSAAQERPR